MKLVNPIVDVQLLRGRWSVTLAVTIAAAFLVVASFAFGAATASGLGFAVGLGIVALGAGLFAISRRAQQYIAVPARDVRVAAWEAISLGIVAIASWNVVQSRVFDAGTGRWLTFADSLGIVVVALAGLVLHELSTERVVHSLEVVRDGSAQPADAERERISA
jgi:hypothetical protein